MRTSLGPECAANTYGDTACSATQASEQDRPIPAFQYRTQRGILVPLKPRDPQATEREIDDFMIGPRSRPG
jgi:hypothetical protein